MQPATNTLFLLSEDWGKIHYNDRIVVYGTGRIGRRVLPSLMKEFQIPFLIDNKDAGSNVDGIPVFAIVQGIKQVKKEKLKIVVATMRGAYNEIAKLLTKYGFKEDEDFCIFERFAQEWNLRWQNRCVLAKIDTVITSRCTLKCRNCNIFISRMDRQDDVAVDSLKKNFDVFFETVDFVYEYTLLGGEPFLHQQIKEILSYLGDKYGNRIGKINLISNGTVLPDKETIGILRKYNVSVHISDYTNTVAYGKKLEKVSQVLQENDIEHYVIPNNVWKDIVYPDLSYKSDNPKAHMLACGHSTHSVGDGKLYWCDPAYAAEKFLGYASEHDDYLDLKETIGNHTKQEVSIEIMRYFLGDMNGKGYMSLCEKCAGIGQDNDRVVKAGRQR